ACGAGLGTRIVRILGRASPGYVGRGEAGYDGPMTADLSPLGVLLVMLSGFVNCEQQHATEYPSRVPRDHDRRPPPLARAARDAVRIRQSSAAACHRVPPEKNRVLKDQLAGRR